MLMALGAISTAIDALQSLTSSSSSQSPSSAQSNPFGLTGDTASSGSAATGSGSNGRSQISPQTMSALIAAQGQSSSTGTASLSPSQALQDLFSQLDANGDGAISKSEFENALGAGGTNLAQADDVFNKLDSNGDGSVSLSELKSALQGAGGHHGGHHHLASSGDSDATDRTGDAGSTSGTSGSTNTDPLLQALAASITTSAATDSSNGLSAASLTPVDRSQLTPISLGTSSYNAMEQMIRRGAQAMAVSAAASLSISA